MSITLPTRVAEKSRRAEGETAVVPLAYPELEPLRQADAEVGPVVSLDHVSFCYEGEATFALRDVSLSVAPGSFVGVIGPSGAGKSTLCSVVSGAAPHHFAGTFRGTAAVDGMDTCEVGLTDVSRVVGSVLQDIDSQMVAAGVEDELLFGLENFGVPRDQVEARLAWALDACGIACGRVCGGTVEQLSLASVVAGQVLAGNRLGGMVAPLLVKARARDSIAFRYVRVKKPIVVHVQVEVVFGRGLHAGLDVGLEVGVDPGLAARHVGRRLRGLLAGRLLRHLLRRLR